MRSWGLLVAVTCLFFITACSFQQETLPNGPSSSASSRTSAGSGGSSNEEPGKTNSVSSTQPSALGPYTDLVGATTDAVERRLGKATSIETDSDPSTVLWVYSDLGLKVAIWKGSSVFWITQTKGRITDQLQIGDSAEKASSLLGSSPAVLPDGGIVIRQDSKQYSLEVHIKDGLVFSAQTLPPDSDQ